jgi:hypothetical protein
MFHARMLFFNSVMNILGNRVRLTQRTFSVNAYLGNLEVEQQKK